MAYSENGGAMTPFTMPVAPMYGGGNDGFGFGGNGAWWLIILLLFANNGWGNGFGIGGGGMMPWMMGNQQDNAIQRGFDQNAVITALGNITNNLQNCCCENRLASADLKYTVATENCEDRRAMSDGFTSMLMNNNANTQAIVNATTAGIQSVMNKICQLELDGKNAQIAELQAQLNDSNRRAESRDEIAQILAGQRNIANEVEQYLNPTPRPAWIVQNPNCCSQNFGYGCGCGQ